MIEYLRVFLQSIKLSTNPDFGKCDYIFYKIYSTSKEETSRGLYQRRITKDLIIQEQQFLPIDASVLFFLRRIYVELEAVCSVLCMRLCVVGTVEQLWSGPILLGNVVACTCFEFHAATVTNISSTSSHLTCVVIFFFLQTLRAGVGITLYTLFDIIYAPKFFLS